MPADGPYLIVLTLASITLLLLLILAAKLDAFLALLRASMALGLGAGFQEVSFEEIQRQLCYARPR